MNIVHFQRKPISSRYFSIENYFEAVREELRKKGYSPQVVVCKYISKGFLPRLYNTIEAAFKQKEINHVTGDVHYINLFFARRRSILTIHDCVFMQHPSALARAVLKFFWLTIPAKRASYITCISDATKQELLQHINFPEDRIVIIPTVVNEDSFSFSSKKFNTQVPSILHVGTTANKNLERVAQALKGIDCVLEIVGPLSKEQQEILIQNGINYNNEVGISNERMVEKYEESDLILFASTYEGFGMPILEAQLTGRPVVTSKIQPMIDVAGQGAVLVDPFNIESIREGVLHVISNETERNRIVKLGLENAKRFSPKKVAQMYIDLYKKALE